MATQYNTAVYRLRHPAIGKTSTDVAPLELKIDVLNLQLRRLNAALMATVAARQNVRSLVERRCVVAGPVFQGAPSAFSGAIRHSSPPRPWPGISQSIPAVSASH